MSEQIPEFYSVVDKLISNIAKKRGEDPEEFKESLLRKILEEQGQ